MIATKIPIELISKIVGHVNALDHKHTFQMQIDPLGNKKFTLNKSSPYVKSVIQLIKTIADCFMHIDLLDDINEWFQGQRGRPSPYSYWYESYPSDIDYEQKIDKYCKGIIGNKKCVLHLDDNDIENITKLLGAEVDELATKLSGVSAENENKIIDCALEALNPELKQYVDSLDPTFWIYITEQTNLKRLERIMQA